MSEPAPFRDRAEGGQALAEELREYADRDDVVVLGLSRGGVETAHEVALALKAPMDVLVVRKIGMPGYEELAIGAIAAGGVVAMNREAEFGPAPPEAAVRAVIEKEKKELERRERLYRNGRPMPVLKGKTVILVDDGLATGATKPFPKTVLVVDDDRSIVNVIKAQLESEGYAVFQSSNAREALEVVRNTQVQVVLLDLGLPDGSGFDVLKSIKVIKPSVPVIIVTGHHQEAEGRLAFKLGALDYVTKPIDFQYLKNVLSIQLPGE